MDRALPDGIGVERGAHGAPLYASTPTGTTTDGKTRTSSAQDRVTTRWSKGTKGPLEGRFRRRVRICRLDRRPTEEVGWLLLETTPDGPRSWICWGLEKASLEEMAAIAHRRFLIERFHEEVKMELGLDHLEGRRWLGLNHHLTLVPIAHTFLVREQIRTTAAVDEVRGAPEGAETPLPTLAEMRRRVVFEVAWARISRAELSRRKEERVGWGKAIERYWADAGKAGIALARAGNPEDRGWRRSASRHFTTAIARSRNGGSGIDRNSQCDKFGAPSVRVGEMQESSKLCMSLHR